MDVLRHYFKLINSQMKALKTIVPLLLFTILLSAQEPMPVIVMGLTGKATFTGEKGKKEEIIAGATILKGSKGNLSNGSSLQLYTDGHFVSLSREGDFVFGDQFDKDAEVLLNFEADFGKSVEDAVWNTLNSGVKLKSGKKLGDAWGTEKPKERGGWGTEKPKERGGWGTEKPKERGGWGAEKPGERGGWGTEKPGERGGWGTEKPGERGGWGNDDMKLMPESPGGVYNNGVNALKWEPVKGQKIYEFYIFNENGLQVYANKTYSNEISVDLRNLNLNPDMQYYWVAGKTQKPPLLTLPVRFNLATDGQAAAAVMAAKSTGTYSQGDAAVRGLMEAVALENTRLNLEAKKAYETLYKSHPKNNLVRMMYAEFCRKNGEFALGKKVLSK